MAWAPHDPAPRKAAALGLVEDMRKNARLYKAVV